MNFADDDAAGLSLAKFWAPRFWPTWLLLIWMRVSVLLPFRWQVAIGARLGRFLMKLSRKTRLVAMRNLELCFPELSERERDKLLRQHFEALAEAARPHHSESS